MATKHALKIPTMPALYDTEKVDANDKIIHARLFALGSAATWLIAEYRPEEKLAYGYSDLYGQGRDGGAEWGYISIAELEELKWPRQRDPNAPDFEFAIPQVEVDAHFTPKKFSECIGEDGRI